MFNHSLQRRRAFARPLALLACTVAATTAAAAPAARPQRASVPNLPLTFEKNTGHWPREVQFVARSGGGTLFLTKREAVLDLRGKGRSAALRLKLAGSNPAAVVTGLDKQSSIVNYFLGNDPKQWCVNVPTYSRVKLAGVYPGVDLVYYGAGKSRALEYDFVVKPGADPSRIRMAVSGAKSLRTVGGRLIASTACGDVTLNRPYAYQTVAGVRRQVACSFTLERNTVAFQVARYDASRPLVVDPVLTYSTLLGDTGLDYGYGIAVDTVGAAYVTGATASAAYPTTAGAYDTTQNLNEDVFVTKLDASGSGLVYSTFIGGSGADYCSGIAIDSDGAAYMTGYTPSSDFPTTAGAYDTIYNTNTDAFVAKLNATGATLVYSTFLGGAGADSGNGIAIDGSRAAYVVGSTASAAFPVTAGAYDTTQSGTDGFVSKLNADGTALVYSTFLGSAGTDQARAIALDGDGAAYVTGSTDNYEFPTTSGAYNTSIGGGTDAFVTKLIANGTALVYSTFLGGELNDNGYGICVDSSGAAYVTGNTGSTGYPTTPGAIDTTQNGASDVFVTKLNAAGTGLGYSTFLGSSSYDYGYAIAVDSAGAAYVTGNTYRGDFPKTSGAYDTVHNGNADAFVSKVDASGAALAYSTFLGGASNDTGQGIALDSTSAVYDTGHTFSTAYPTTVGAYDTSYSSTGDVFVSKLTLPAATTLSVSSVTGQVGERVYITATLTSGGSGVSGATVRFTMPGGATIDRLTDAAGIADYYWDIPAGQAGATIGAAFAGNASYQLSSGSGALTVTVASKVTVLPATGTAGQSTGIVAYLWDGKSMSGLTGKQLTLKIDGGAASNFPALTSGTYGKTTYTYAIPAAMAGGAHSTTVDWAGGGGYPASQGTGTLNVTALANTYVWVHSHGASQNVATKLTCYLYDYRRNGDLIPVSGKSISFSVAGTTVGTATTDNSGKAFRNHTPASAGALTQTMSFAGDAAYAAASNTGTLTVAP